MCLVLSIIALVFSFNYYTNQNYSFAFVSLLVAIFFIALMLRNIKYVKKIKKEKKHDN